MTLAGAQHRRRRSAAAAALSTGNRPPDLMRPARTLSAAASTESSIPQPVALPRRAAAPAGPPPVHARLGSKGFRPPAFSRASARPRLLLSLSSGLQ
jgi:hypothetical protein